EKRIKQLDTLKDRGVAYAQSLQGLSRLIPAREFVARELGVTTAELPALLKSGAVDANTAIRRILKGISRQYGDLAEQQTRSAAATIAKIKDAASEGAGALSEGFFGPAERNLDRLKLRLEDPATQEALRKLGADLARDVIPRLHEAADFVEQHWPQIERDTVLIAKAIRDVAGAVQTLVDALTKIGSVGPGGGDGLVHLLVAGLLVRKLLGADTAA